MTNRPDPPRISDGIAHCVPLHDEQWQVLTMRAHCRYGGGNKQRACGRPAVAEFNRRRWSKRLGRYINSWWAYCEEHVEVYGRWVEDGVVMHWVARLNEEKT